METAKEGPVVSHDEIVYVLKISHCCPWLWLHARMWRIGPNPWFSCQNHKMILATVPAPKQSMSSPLAFLGSCEGKAGWGRTSLAEKSTLPATAESAC